jgi:surface protein
MVVSRKKHGSKRKGKLQSTKKTMRMLGAGSTMSRIMTPAQAGPREPITDNNIRAAVALWRTNKRRARTVYGRIGEWDVSAVTNMSNLFSGNDRRSNEFNDDISGWNVGSVTNMNSMFFYTNKFNQNIGSWNVGSVTNMDHMFSHTSRFNQDIGEWKVGSVTNMMGMFSQAQQFNQDIGEWKVGSVTNMMGMFSQTYAFNQDIGEWTVSNVTNMSNMFSLTRMFNQDIGGWDVSNVTNMHSMFFNAYTFNQDIGEWDVGSVTNMGEMFFNAKKFNQNIGGWNVSNVTQWFSIFIGADAFEQDLSRWTLSARMVRVMRDAADTPNTWFNTGYNPDFLPIMPRQEEPEPVPNQDPTNIHSKFDQFVEQHGDTYLAIIDRGISNPTIFSLNFNFVSKMRSKFIAHINNNKRMIGDTQEQRDHYVVKINLLMDKMAGYNFRSDLLKKIATKSVEYALAQPPVPAVLSRLEQPPSFADEYVKVFINESMESFSSGRNFGGNMSCVLGIVERFTTSVGSAAMTICLGTDVVNETCTEDYMKLYRLFSGNEINLNEITQAWALSHEAGRTDRSEVDQTAFDNYFNATNTKETRKQFYIDYVTRIVESQGLLTPDMVSKIKAEADKIEYVFVESDKDVGVQFGGCSRRKRKHCRKTVKHKSKPKNRT